MNGQIMLPFKGTGLTLVAAFNGLTGIPMDFGRYMLFIIPMNLFMILCYVLVCRFVLRVGVSALKQLSVETIGVQKKLSKDQSRALFFLAVIIILFIAPSILPATWGIVIFLNKLTLFGQVAAVVAIMMVLKKEDGTPFVDFKHLASKGMAWDALYMTCLILPISSFLTADATGIKPFLGNLLEPLTQFPPVFFIIAVMAFATIITNFANKTILAIIIMPVLYSFAEQVGMNPISIILLLFITTQLALATPGASPLTGIIFSNSDWVKASDLIKVAIIQIAILFVVCMVIGFPWSTFVFSI